MKKIILATICVFTIIASLIIMISIVRQQVLKNIDLSGGLAWGINHILRSEHLNMIKNGAFPLDLSLVVQEIYERNPNVSFKNWNGLYYVSGLKTNDPPMTPIVILSSNKTPHGRVLYINGRNHILSHFDSETRKVLVAEPWKLVRDEFTDEEEYKAFTNRLKLIKTEGLK